MMHLLILEIILSSQIVSYTVENRSVQLPDTIKATVELSPFLGEGLLIENFELLLEDSTIIQGKLEIIIDPLSKGYQLNFSSLDSRIYDRADVYLKGQGATKSSSYNVFGNKIESERKFIVSDFSENEKIRVALYKRGVTYSLSVIIYEGLK